MFSLKRIQNRREFFHQSVFGMASLGVFGAEELKKPNFNREKVFSFLKKGEDSKKIGIIICARYESCGGGKCLRSMREHVGGFSKYPKGIPLDIVGFGQCGGCPGGNVEYVPEEMKKNGAEVIHLATGFVVGYPPCPYTLYFKNFIEIYYELPVVIGTHPIPLKYLEAHSKLPSIKEIEKVAPYLLEEDRKVMLDYN
jgi:predicted metal-binding protein